MTGPEFELLGAFMWLLIPLGIVWLACACVMSGKEKDPSYKPDGYDNFIFLTGMIVFAFCVVHIWHCWDAVADSLPRTVSR